MSSDKPTNERQEEQLEQGAKKAPEAKKPSSELAKKLDTEFEQKLQDVQFKIDSDQTFARGAEREPIKKAVDGLFENSLKGLKQEIGGLEKKKQEISAQKMREFRTRALEQAHRIGGTVFGKMHQAREQKEGFLDAGTISKKEAEQIAYELAKQGSDASKEATKAQSTKYVTQAGDTPRDLLIRAGVRFDKNPESDFQKKLAELQKIDGVNGAKDQIPEGEEIYLNMLGLKEISKKSEGISASGQDYFTKNQDASYTINFNRSQEAMMKLGLQHLFPSESYLQVNDPRLSGSDSQFLAYKGTDGKFYKLEQKESDNYQQSKQRVFIYGDEIVKKLDADKIAELNKKIEAVKVAGTGEKAPPSTPDKGSDDLKRQEIRNSNNKTIGTFLGGLQLTTNERDSFQKTIIESMPSGIEHSEITGMSFDNSSLTQKTIKISIENPEGKLVTLEGKGKNLRESIAAAFSEETLKKNLIVGDPISQGDVMTG